MWFGFSHGSPWKGELVKKLMVALGDLLALDFQIRSACPLLIIVDFYFHLSSEEQISIFSLGMSTYHVIPLVNPMKHVVFMVMPSASK